MRVKKKIDKQCCQEVGYPAHDTIHTNDETPSGPQDLQVVRGGEDTCLEVTWRPPQKGVYCVDSYTVAIWSSGESRLTMQCNGTMAMVGVNVDIF